LQGAGAGSGVWWGGGGGIVALFSPVRTKRKHDKVTRPTGAKRGEAAERPAADEGEAEGNPLSQFFLLGVCSSQRRKTKKADSESKNTHDRLKGKC